MIKLRRIFKPVKTTAIVFTLAASSWCMASDAIGLPPPESPLSLLVYKMEILNYCGFIDNEISAGFKYQRDQIIAELKLTPKQVQQARSEGWQSGLAEWQNRGLGGFRNWCKTDGKAAAEYFRKIGNSVDKSS